MDGFLNCLKPPKLTSAKAVALIKKNLGNVKIGHLGTLDPPATGVLPVAVGRAAKFFDLAQELPKTYVAGIKFGLQTDTLDYDGKITATDNKTIDTRQLNSALEKFRGEITQVPPAYSALKIDGIRSYKLARSGMAPELKPRKVTIYDLTLTDQAGENEYLLSVTCSSGTYIRSLIKDIAAELDTVAVLSVLIRTKACNMDIQNAKLPDDLNSDDLLPVEKVFGYESVELTGKDLFKAKNGGTFETDKQLFERFYIEEVGKIFALAQVISAGLAKPIIRLD